MQDDFSDISSAWFMNEQCRLPVTHPGQGDKVFPVSRCSWKATLYFLTPGNRLSAKLTANPSVLLTAREVQEKI